MPIPGTNSNSGDTAMNATIIDTKTATETTTETTVMPGLRPVMLAAAADLVWPATTDETVHVAAGAVALRMEDLNRATAGDALPSMLTNADDVGAFFVTVRNAWRALPADKRCGAWSVAKEGKPSVPVFPAGNDVKRLLSAILGYAEGVESPMPQTGSKAPAPVGAIRSAIRPLVQQYAETDSYEETVRLMADDEATKTDVRVTIDNSVLTVYRPGPVLEGPWIDAKAFSKACAPWTLTGKDLKVGKVGRQAAVPTGNGWTVKRFLSIDECAKLLAKAGIVKDTKKGDMRETQRAALVCPAVSGKDYDRKKAEIEADMVRRVVRSITDACGGKITAEQAQFTAVEKGAAARGALVSSGLEAQAETADSVNYNRGLVTVASDWK
jgi:hypothetical protein